jgi:hypothetical protein
MNRSTVLTLSFQLRVPWFGNNSDEGKKKIYNIDTSASLTWQARRSR